MQGTAADGGLVGVAVLAVEGVTVVGVAVVLVPAQETFPLYQNSLVSGQSEEPEVHPGIQLRAS
jgi:hypothetical protein